MLLSHDKKFCFIHTPKTGGSTISYVLNKYCRNIAVNEKEHGWQIPLHEYGMHRQVKQVYQHIPKGYYTFAFVRNPFAVLVSGFKRKGYENFKQFIISTFKEGSNYIFNKWTQYDYLSVDDKISLNFVGRYENFATDWNHICSQIGIEETYDTLPVKNASYQSDYRDYYDDETRKIVEKKYEKDLEYWGYKF
jgi:hypothetical protein